MITFKVSPVADTEFVVLTEENPSASATEPVSVPPLICRRPAESMLDVPPKACIWFIKLLIVVVLDTVSEWELKDKLYPPETLSLLPRVLIILPSVDSPVAVVSIVCVILLPKTVL